MASISRVLCPIDFSEPAAHAFDQASAIAGWYGASLTALYVYTPLFMPVPGLPGPSDRVPECELHRAREQAVSFVRARPGPVGADIVVDVGQPARCILDRASSLPASLIVMGTHGASGFERFALGSVTEKVLRKAACPVLTVPPRARTTSRFPFTRILCAVDFAEWSSAAVDTASSLAKETGASLELLSVVEWPWDEPPPPRFADLPPDQAASLLEFRRYLTSSASDRLESLIPDDMRQRGVVTTRVSHGKAYPAILRVAEEQKVDLIVMGVHGRNPIDLAMFGSTTNQVVRRATCPVLTLRR